jgi:hypothetical protein
VSLNLAPNSTHFVEFTLGEVQFSFREATYDVAVRSLPELRQLN